MTNCLTMLLVSINILVDKGILGARALRERSLRARRAVSERDHRGAARGRAPNTMSYSRRLRQLDLALRPKVPPSSSALGLTSSALGLTQAAMESVHAGAENDDDGTALTQQQIDLFLEEGYCTLPGILPPDLIQRLRDEMDRRAEDGVRGGAAAQGRQVVSYKELGLLCSLPMVIEKLKQLFKAYGNGESQMAMHHIHANRQLPGVGSSNWHQDYEQLPQTDRDQLMVHVFYYLNGLDGTVGDLMVLPRSHNSVMERGAFSTLWQDFELPGSLTFGAKIPLPPGSAVIAHSALMHGRRKMPGGDPHNPRYFIDVSYCQPGPRRWPNYGRGYETQHEINTICMENGYDRGGRYAHLFDPELPLFYNRDADDAPPEVIEFNRRQRLKQRANLERLEQEGKLNENQKAALERLRA